MAEEFGDKTEAPTPHKRAEARREGKIPHSADLSAAAMTVASLLLLQQFGPRAVAAMKMLMTECLAAQSHMSMNRMIGLLAIALSPIFVGMFAIGIAANLAQTGFFVRFKSDLSNINPANGFARIFSGRSALQLLVDIAKLAGVGAITYFSVRSRMWEVITLQSRPIGELMSAGVSLIFSVAIRIALFMLALGVLDYFLKRWRHERELRMTRREVKEEARQLEGDPMRKNRRRQVAGARKSVASSDVVNPIQAG